MESVQREDLGAFVSMGVRGRAGLCGLPTALLFALHDFTVQGVDVSPQVLENIQTQQIPSVYPELADWWGDVQEEGHFRAAAQPEPVDVFIITVPPPWNQSKKLVT